MFSVWRWSQLWSLLYRASFGGRFVVLCSFFRVIESYVWEKTFVFWSFFWFQKGIKTCCCTKKVHSFQNLNIFDFEREKLVRFLNAVGSIFRLVTETGYKQDFSEMKSYFAKQWCWNETLIKYFNIVPNTPAGQVTAFLICINFVEVYFLLSQSSGLAGSLQLWRCVSFSNFVPSFSFIVFLDIWQLLFFYCFTLDSWIFNSPIKSLTRNGESELQRIFDFYARFKGTQTKIGKCFPFHFVAAVTLKLSFCTRMFSITYLAKILQTACSFVYSVPKESSLSSRVFWILYTFFW